MAQPEVIKDIEARVKKSGDTMTGLLKTNGSIENQGEARFSHPTYCPNIEDTAVGIGCAFKASRGHFNQMNVNEIYLPATATTNYESNKILFKSYSGGNNGTYTGVSEIAQINTTGLKVGSSSIGINGYIEGTWLRTTSAGNKAGDFAIIDSLGWIYKRTPAQVLSDIGAASKSHDHNSLYVKKSGDTMTGNLTAPKFIGSLLGNADTATTAERAKTVPYALTSNGTTSTTTAGYTYGVAGVTSGNRIFAKWYVNLNTGNKTLSDGMLIEIKIPVAGCSSGDCITIDGTNFHPVVYNTNTIITTQYGVNTKLLLMYDSSTSANVYGSSTGATATASAAISGVWRVMNNYDANSNTVPSAYCTTAAATAAKTATCTNYVLLAKSYLHVIIKMANTAASALTFNVNGRGAKPIYINGSASSSSNYTLPAGSYLVYYNGTNYYFRTDGGILGGSFIGNASTATTATNATNVNIAADTSSKIYVLGATTTGNTRIYRESSVYMSSNVLYGAAWNDYAEYRSSDPVEPGRVICETGTGTLKLSTERLQPGANVVSDTFGFAIGETENCKTPIAVSGRALVYTYEDRYSYEAGDPVCAAPGGTVSKMSREEVMMYPDRIVGTVSEIPEYERWGTGNVEVKNRIWIKVK